MFMLMVARNKPKIHSITLTVFVEVTVNDLFVTVSEAIRFMNTFISPIGRTIDRQTDRQLNRQTKNTTY